MHDVVVVGCGPAGLSAAIFCARANLKTLVLPNGTRGKKLLEEGVKQAKKFRAEFLVENAVSAKQIEGGQGFEVTTEKNKREQCRSIIIATGIPITSSGIKNEGKFVGKGLSYCVSCDGFFFKGKKVAIIGNSNHAADEAVDLLHYTGDVTIISDNEKFEFSKEFEAEIRKRKIKVLNKNVEEFRGEKFLHTIVFSDHAAMDFDGVFMACGTSSAIDFARELGVVVENNVLAVDERNMTNVPGVFACGNCVGRCRQVAANVGEGANAAVNAIKFVGAKELYMDYATK
ncbi:MAG: FAD-dependent oxidoreductase [Candidatus Diapherotrites archaeon]|nr:FAD-dependent oxidoreductase [Candidatus Diapherotrites archaeon]